MVHSLTLPEDIAETVQRALGEDIGTGDLTANLIPESTLNKARVISREEAILCGAAWFDETFRQINTNTQVKWQIQDGDRINSGQVICELNGLARVLLTGERTSLNFLQLLSGTATQARQYVDAVRGTTATILDTRKTLPGLRRAQKYATSCGGCRNHRMGLYDGILIKENHIRAAGSIEAALTTATHYAPSKIFVEIEVENLDQLREALAVGATRLLLDNFDIPNLIAAVAENRGRAELEASGGITLANIRAVAETGVDFISIGDITKNVRAIDLSMQFV